MAENTGGTSRFIITYEDGSTVTAKVKPRHLVALEDEVGIGLDIKGIRDGFKLAWIATDSDVPFDEWIKDVDSIDSAGPVADATVEVPAEDGEATEAVPTE